MHHRAAFTLVEMSLVVVILGLIVGGALGGRALARAAELRGVMTDANAYITAINNFNQQYKSLPGDFARAATYWPAATGGGGDGQVTGDERFAAWNHLHLAGMVDFDYTGAQGSGGADDFVIDSNVPMGRMKNSGYAFYYEDMPSPVAVTNKSYDTPAANMLVFGAAAGTDNGPPIDVIFKPGDAFSVDSKMDDGKPGTGNWIAYMGGGDNFASGTGCTKSTNNTDYSKDYNLAITSLQCAFLIFGGW